MPHPTPSPGEAPLPLGALVAAALETHRALSRGSGANVPLTALEPACGIQRFAAFVTVYAAAQAQGVTLAPGPGRSAGAGTTPRNGRSSGA